VERQRADDHRADHMTSPVGFGVIGANSYVANEAVLPAIEAATNATLVATASRSAAVPERWASTDASTYQRVLAHPDVEAVYIPLPNDLHCEWTERAAAAGKHVLCEKPLATDAATARVMAQACADADVLLAEAWMTPFDRRWDAMIQLAKGGLVGDITRQHNCFTFTIEHDQADNYRWNPEHGGGALLDVGIYCLGTAVELWGVDCTIDDATSVRSLSGVDATTIAELRWPGDRTAHIRCSFVEDEIQWAEFVGSKGRLILEAAAFTSGDEFDHLLARTHTDPDVEMRPATVQMPNPEGHLASRQLPLYREPEQIGGDDKYLMSADYIVEPGDPYRAMVEAFAKAVRNDAEWPRPVERSIELLELIDRIREAAHG
jgi:D-xylose 1-dehydrogenase (NADP+, D-xylono-1,5-lactone-forming)